MALLDTGKSKAKVLHRGDPADLDNVTQIEIPAYIEEMAGRHELEDKKDAGKLLLMASKGDEFPGEALREAMDAKAEKDEDFDADNTYQCYEAYWEEVKADLSNSEEIAKALKEKKAADAEAKKAAREKAKAEKEAAKKQEEKDLAEASKGFGEAIDGALMRMDDFTPTLPTEGLLPDGFDIDPLTNRTVIPKDASKEDLMAAFSSAVAMRQQMERVSDSLYFFVGDTILAYRNLYGDTWLKAIESTGIEEVLGLSKATLRKMPYVCERFPNAKRKKGLTYTHYAEAHIALPKDEEQKVAVMKEVEEVLATAAKGKKIGKGANARSVPLPAQAYVRVKCAEIRDKALGKDPKPATIEATVIGVEWDPEGDAPPKATVQYATQLSGAEGITLARQGFMVIPRKDKLRYHDIDGSHDIKWLEPGTIDTSAIDKENEEKAAAEAAAKAEKEAKKNKKDK